MPPELKTIRRWLVFFIVALILSGVTAFALETELGWLVAVWPARAGACYDWLNKVYEALRDTNVRYL